MPETNGLNLSQIKSDALAATQGEWSDIDGGGDLSNAPAHIVIQRKQGAPWFICDMQGDLDVPEVGGCPVANARHIANMDPPTTIALVEEVERLRSENAILCLVLKNALEDGIDIEFEEWGKEARQATGADQ